MKEELSKVSSMQNFEMIQRERLPTLYEVLIQRTSQPVDLWTFYTFLSQFPYAINYLDFWVDLMTHTTLQKLHRVGKKIINQLSTRTTAEWKYIYGYI